MKTIKRYLILSLFAFYAIIGAAQVGIGTTNPEGALDISSGTYGVVYPTVSLTSSVDAVTVKNPQGGSIVVGTTVYNDAETNTGTNDIKPGIYSWDGSKWFTHFYKRETTLFEQTTELRTTSSGGYKDIPGLGVADSKTFVPKFSGLYKIEVKVNYGAGEVVDNLGMHTVTGRGRYRFIFDGTTKSFYTRAISSYHPDVGSGTHYKNIWKESYINEYVQLVAGQSYSFSIEFDQLSGAGFVNNGNSGDGRGYIGTDIPCFVEFTFLSE